MRDGKRNYSTSANAYIVAAQIAHTSTSGGSCDRCRGDRAMPCNDDCAASPIEPPRISKVSRRVELMTTALKTVRRVTAKKILERG